MDPWILKAIAVFAVLLIADVVLFVICYRRNKRYLRVIRVERILTSGWRKKDNK